MEIITRNRDSIKDFLSFLYPSQNCQVALCLIPPDLQPVEHRFTTVANLPKFLPYAKFRNAHGWNVYITPSVLKPRAQNRRKESFLPEQSIIYLDCDVRSCLDAIKARYPYPTLVVKTSKGRYQVYWKLDTPINIEQQEQLMSAMAVDIGADRAATDVSRVLRLPSFWNRKQGRAPNTVDVVFTRNQTVTYKSLSLRATEPALKKQAPPEQTSTQWGASRVLVSPVVERGGGKGRMTESERDWYLINRWLFQGVTREECIWRVSLRRCGHKRDVGYYATYSVDKAISIRQEVSCGKE